jgi:hypothetical protein
MFLPWESCYYCNDIGFDRATQSIVIARSVSDEAIHPFFLAKWIASRSLSSGAHSRDPLARNDA